MAHSGMKYFKFNNLFFRLLIYILLLLSKQDNVNNKLSEITLTIRGKGNNIKILSSTEKCGETPKKFNDYPNRVIINNITQNFSSIYIFT